MTTYYGKSFVTLTPIENVECWNCSDGTVGTIPAETTLKVEYAYDATHTVVMVETGPGLLENKSYRLYGVKLGDLPNGQPHFGYRFIVPNGTLGAAISVDMPESTPDLIGDLIAYEDGTATEETTSRLFRTLKKTGIGSRLQGHYSSRM